MDEIANEKTPAPLPPDVMADPGSAAGSNMPLHLRVLEVIVQGQADEARLRQGLEIAHEIYELETARVGLDDYQSSS
jgi:hypothetical protein